MTPRLVSLPEIESLREAYRAEMPCQIIHDSIHGRPGWTREYLIEDGGKPTGYGSVAVMGPWRESHTIYEFYVAPALRLRAFEAFAALVAASSAVKIETQSNDRWTTVMLHTFARSVETESILFEDAVTTSLAPVGAQVRRAADADAESVRRYELDDGAKWVLTLADEVAGAGDILHHYNRPYGDVYMKIAEPYRRRGLGAFLVQELKRICREGGSVPGARCNVGNVASRAALQKAGFVPCGHILVGSIGAPAA